MESIILVIGLRKVHPQRPKHLTMGNLHFPIPLLDHQILPVKLEILTYCIRLGNFFRVADYMVVDFVGYVEAQGTCVFGVLFLLVLFGFVDALKRTVSHAGKSKPCFSRWESCPCWTEGILFSPCPCLLELNWKQGQLCLWRCSCSERVHFDLPWQTSPSCKNSGGQGVLPQDSKSEELIQIRVLLHELSLCL